MFMNDVYKKDEIKDCAIQDLRRMGVKYRRKKTKNCIQDVKKSLKCFKVDLNLLPTQVVTLNDGQQLIVPIVVHDLCSFILKKVNTEGLFRKEGSKSRQNEIKLSLNAGCKIEQDYHVIDVAAILKVFLRELPEPLIPIAFHEYFLRCIILETEKLEAVLLLCLLLPQEHLNTLAYLLRFFHAVTKHAVQNKMTALNLSIVVGPNVMPFQQDKASYATQHKIKKTCELVQLLIENANKVGIIPDYIIDQVAKANSNASVESLITDKKKKRRSGSLTRMFNGLRKIVGNKTEEISPTVVTPDLLLTPSISRSVKKRKIESLNLSCKKKKDVISKLPEGKILKIPFTPISTPISENPKGKEKKSQWYSKNKLKNSKTENEGNLRSSRTSLGPRSLIERRWSAVSNAAAFSRKNKKRSSYGDSHKDLNTDSSKLNTSLESKLVPHCEDSFVKIPKVEYEQIKNRVSEIERRISIEIDNVQSQMDPSIQRNDDNLYPVQDVEKAYVQTLVHMEALSPTTDQLARRLSRELKIRRSSDNIIIRSPSARKIGTIKRRSRELERNNKLTRNQSWHVQTRSYTIPKTCLKNDAGSIQTDMESISTPNLNDLLSRTPSSKSLRSNFDVSANSWTNADNFFATVKTPKSEASTSNGRPSVAKLRSQNAGMVLAKAKLFDNILDITDSNTSNKSNKNTINDGNIKHSDIKLQRGRNSRDDKKIRKSSSPRKSRLNLSKRQKLNAAKQLVEDHRNETNEKEGVFSIDRNLISPVKFTPCKTPVIKKPLLTRSPKRLCRTPCVNRSTPLKVFTPRPLEC